MMSNNIPMSTYVSCVDSGDNKLTDFKYVVPMYQRPYSWGEQQIDDFLRTIFEGLLICRVMVC